MPKEYMSVRYGGKPIAAGGYGCVFRPALAHSENPRVDGAVSKLMFESDAQEEYAVTNIIRERLSAIPNYEKYFVLKGVEIGTPDPLSESDLQSFDVCSHIFKNTGITADNVNMHLAELRVINLPDSGIAVDDYLRQHDFEPNVVAAVNAALIELLQNAIVPMNALGVYHYDLKDSNVLISESETGEICARIIDWGICAVKDSGEYNAIIAKRTGKSSTSFHGIVSNRAFQFNGPFSMCMISNDFNRYYANVLEQCKRLITPEEIRTAMVEFFYAWRAKNNAAHFATVNDINRRLFLPHMPVLQNVVGSIDPKHPDELLATIVETNFTYYYVIAYLAEIAQFITTFEDGENHADMETYIDDVFLHNVDIWGFVMIYKSLLKNSDTKYYETLRRVFVKCLYETATVAIDVPELCALLSAMQSDARISEAMSVVQERTETAIVTATPSTPQSTTKQLVSQYVPVTGVSPTQTTVAPFVSTIGQSTAMLLPSSRESVSDSDEQASETEPKTEVTVPYDRLNAQLITVEPYFSESTNKSSDDFSGPISESLDSLGSFMTNMSTIDPLTNMRDLYETMKTRKRRVGAHRRARPTKRAQRQ